MLPVLIRMGPGSADWKSCLWLGLTAGPGYAAFTYTGLVYAPAAHGAALTAGMLPLFTIVIGAFAGVVQITWVRVLGLTLMVLATLMFFLDGSDGANGTAWFGDLLLLGGPMVWSFYTLRVQSLKLDAIRATAIVSVFGFLMFAPIYGLIGQPRHLVEAGAMSSVSQGIFHGWIVVVGSLTLFTHAVRTLGPAVTTLATATVPAIVAIAAAVLLSEPFTWRTAAGVGFDAAGLVCVSIALMRASRTQPS